MIRGMSRRALLIVAGWLAAAAAAIGTGLAGVQVIGGGITTGSGGDVLTSAEAADQLARAGTPSTGSATPRPTAPAAPSSATPTPTGPTNLRTLTGPAGFVIAGCTPAGAVLISWTPAQGYAIERADPGPGGEYAEVRFTSGLGGSGKGHGEVRVRVRCVDGVPVAEWHS
jgi:hypothetical protein